MQRMADAAVPPSSSEADNGPDHAAAARPGRLRRALVAALVILGCVLATLSLLAIWTDQTLFDTDNYVAAVAPLAKNHDIQEAGATRITNRILQNTDLTTRLEDALPARAKKAAPAMTSALGQVVHDAALRLLSSDQFAKIWESANRRVQPQVVAALTGSTSRVKVDNGTVSLDLSGAATRVRARIAELGFDVQSKLPGRQVNTTIELFQWPWLGAVQDGVDLLQRLAWLLPVLMLLCFAGAIALSPNRRRTILRSGLGISAGAAVALVALNLGRGPYLDLFSQPDGKQAGGAAYDQILHGLRIGGRAVFVLGLVIAFGAWLAGSSESAVRTRDVLTNRARLSAPTGLSAWVAAHKKGLRIVIIVLGVGVLAVVDTVSGLTVIVITVLVLVALASVELLGRPGPAPAVETPAAS